MSDKLICDRLVEIIDPVKYRSGCLEYGASDNYAFENHLFTFEQRNWRVLCLQPDEEKFKALRIYRRLCKLIDCENDSNNTIDGFLEKTNVPEIKIFLIKQTEYPSRVLRGFSPKRWNTEIISVQYPNLYERQESENIIFGHGFQHLETTAVAEFYIKPGGEMTGIAEVEQINSGIFEV